MAVQRVMLWGANAGRKRLYREAGAEDFGDFGKYMAEKRRKLRLQFQTEADASTKDTSDPVAATLHAETSNSGILDNSAVSILMTKLFEGISIFVDGFTIPSHQELRMLMIKYGGYFENYFRRDSVTHIICSTLPDSKIKDIRSCSRGLPVVKPSWIVDSINHGRVLPFSSYQLERVVHDDPNQSTIAQFLAFRGDYLSTQLPLADAPNLRITKTSSQQESNTCLGVATCRKEQSDSLELASSASKPSGSSYVVDESTFQAAKEISKSPEGSNSAAICDDIVAGSTCAHSTLGDTNFVRNFFQGQQEGKVLDLWLDASSRDVRCEGGSPIKASYVSINEKGANQRINNTKDTISWGLSKAPLSKGKGMQSLGKVLKGPFSARRPTSHDVRGKQKAAGAYTLPNVSELDPSVLACLPPEIMAEINEVYGGAIALCMSGSAGAHTSCTEKCLAKVETSEVQQRVTVANSLAENENNDKGSMMDLRCVEMRTVACDAKESVSLSLSQIDVAILEELPAEMHQEILMSLPKHQPIAAKEESKSENCRVDVVGQPGSSGNGNEDAFPCKLLDEHFLQGDSSQNLSVILLEYTRACSTPSEMCSSGLRSAVFQRWLEFLKQYLKVKAACNLEEVFMVARALKRLGALREFWHQICDLIVPFVQALSSEHYGGSLLL